MGYTAGLMDKFIRAIGNQANNMEKVYQFHIMVFNELAFGKMANAING